MTGPNPTAAETSAKIDWKREFTHTPRTIHVGDHALNVVDEGTGPLLLLVHGNPTWSFMWRRLFPEFIGTHRLVAVDHLGCGFSDKPQRFPYSLARHGDNLAELIRQLDLRDITLVAHDWGGAIGLYAALLREPDRFRRFVLMNTGAFPPHRIPWRIAACRIPWLGTLAIRGANLFLEAAFWMAVEKRQSMSEISRAGFRAPYGGWRERIGIQRFVSDIPMSSAHPTWNVLRELEQALPRLDAYPTQFIWGMRDWCFDQSCLERFRQFVPRAEVTPLETAGHWVLEEQPREVIAALRGFLHRHPLEAPLAVSRDG